MKSGTKGSKKARLDYEALLAEAYGNIVSDRKTLSDMLSDLRKTAEEDEEGSMAAELVKATVVVSEGLTRSNAQLVELVKTEAKRQRPDDDDAPLSAEEAESVYAILSAEDKSGVGN